ncbi:MAG TPA: NAD-dependent epimerase [Spirochaetota bacterium]|nr:NAD-dependent epimerase [Spirochaetota bacterium]HOA06840.1 NAD-dependent epimerase [Spirochaetota bacterium]HOH36605.1 NAD-dependent epimerase [Spirochaetota bacterium]HPJ14924.1 NAD-dependent epimerase [Spirochaetota bacterium]HPM34427.1 NAD-dependent epimerase [Spirochaetota bacterium]
MKYLITGSAGFIGFHLSKLLLKDGHEIVGVDNLNSYYPVSLKSARNEILLKNKNYSFHHKDISDRDFILKLFSKEKFDVVINLAAQAGVRYSLDNPSAYIGSNIDGFLSILEGCRNNPVKHLVYASSSSVYGANKKTPFSESDYVDNPISLYAATKKSNELMAHCYSHLFDIPASGLRFFTVYGEYGRPDMAYFKFTDKIVQGQEIEVYNNGDMLRDFTFVDDIVSGIMSVASHIPKPGYSAESGAKHIVYNIGNNNPVQLEYFIEVLEKNLGTKALKKYMPMQPGDVYATFADISLLNSKTGWKPKTSIEEGLSRFVEWYKNFYI